VADCSADGLSCSNVRSVINPLNYSLVHVNDPSIVLVPANENTPAYYIMYMTVLKTGGGNNIQDTNISYSTSWANDGINWSAPTLLLNGYWLPSVLRKPTGDIELFAYGLPGSGHPFLTKFSLGTGGTNPTPVGQVQMTDAQGQNSPESNAYVTYNTDGFYQILGESMPADGKSQIDYLTSIDGLSWSLQKAGIVKADSANSAYRVGTPAVFPGNIFKIYFGSTKQTDSMGFKILEQEWSL
jgi:hypothetical protein